MAIQFYLLATWYVFFALNFIWGLATGALLEFVTETVLNPKNWCEPRERIYVKHRGKPDT